MIGKKRQRELLEDELFYFPKDYRNKGEPNESESEESKHEFSQKRNKTSDAPSSSTTPTQMASSNHVPIVFHNDASMGIMD